MRGKFCPGFPQQPRNSDIIEVKFFSLLKIPQSKSGMSQSNYVAVGQGIKFRIGIRGVMKLHSLTLSDLCLRAVISFSYFVKMWYNLIYTGSAKLYFNPVTEL